MRETLPPRKRLGTTVKLLLLVGTLAATLTACLSPVMPNNRPTVVLGESNGAVDADLITTVAGCNVHDSVAPSLRAMLAGATRAGIALRGASCYRDYAGQVATRDYWCAQGACHMAAVPGNSNHGWGKAVDFATTGSFTFDSRAYRWMKTYAWLYGWNHPGWAEPTGSAPEAWHWEWVGDGGTLYPGRSFGPR